MSSMHQFAISGCLFFKIYPLIVAPHEFVRASMRHECNIEIDYYISEAYVEPYPYWIVRLTWLSAFLFGGFFWWGVIEVLTR